MRFRFVILLFAVRAFATVFGTVQGVVHDPSHRPVAAVDISLHAANSGFELRARSRR